MNESISADRQSTRGGRRENSGRKSVRDEVATSDAYERLIEAKAQREETNAERDRIKLLQEAGALVELDEVMQLYTTTVAIFAEQIRSIPDLLERKAGLSAKQAQTVADEIDSQLEQLEARLMKDLNPDE